MQEIKFQVWDGELMHEVAELVWCNGPNLDGKGLKFYGPGVGASWIDGKSVILRQFTGLLDKNEKPIYEGDVVWVLIERYSDPKKPILGKVVRDRCFWFVQDLNDIYHDIWSKDKFEVIGNIYENQEFLTGSLT